MLAARGGRPLPPGGVLPRVAAAPGPVHRAPVAQAPHRVVAAPAPVTPAAAAAAALASVAAASAAAAGARRAAPSVVPSPQEPDRANDADMDIVAASVIDLDVEEAGHAGRPAVAVGRARSAGWGWGEDGDWVDVGGRKQMRGGYGDEAVLMSGGRFTAKARAIKKKRGLSYRTAPRPTRSAPSSIIRRPPAPLPSGAATPRRRISCPLRRSSATAPSSPSHLRAFRSSDPASPVDEAWKDTRRRHRGTRGLGAGTAAPVPPARGAVVVAVEVAARNEPAPPPRSRWVCGAIRPSLRLPPPGGAPVPPVRSAAPSLLERVARPARRGEP